MTTKKEDFIELKKQKIENTENLKKQIEECQKLKDEYLNSWKRERADFLNYKKDEAERMGEMVAFIGGAVVLKIIPILDNLDIAEQKLPEDLKEDENVKGVLQIRKQMSELLKSMKVTEIETIGKKFDPNFHEAVAEESKEGVEPGMIVEEIKKGYLLNGKVLVPAKVRIGK